ncbi:HK97 family phage prohead protease [Oceanimonas sp. NS1]|nr:HK97 family phage prohead protease [Oceanimonas sp. NS1]
MRALFNHDPNFVLGRTRSGTLALSVDADGLRYEIDPPDTQTVRDLVLAPLARGDITGSSFAFAWRRTATSGEKTTTA